jgi:hypothetical protein
MRLSSLRAALTAGSIVVPAMLLSACNIQSIGASSLPPGVPDPTSLKNPAGAMEMYQGAIHAFEYSEGVQTLGSGAAASNGAFIQAMLSSGLVSDELSAGNLGGPIGDYYPNGLTSTDSTDSRNILAPTAGAGNGGGSDAYSALQGVRTAAAQAIGALQAYDPAAPAALRGHLYAYRGYAETLLAELYCSGVPLSTYVFNGDYVLAPSSTTAQVLQAAVAQFDTALTLGADSAQLVNLARVGIGRAQLDLGQYGDAAQAVAQVPDNFQFQFWVDWTGEQANRQGIFSIASATVSDREGVNGLPFISSGDPRSAVVVAPTSPNLYGQQQYLPAAYGGNTLAVAPITVASGVEARLIEAEAALQANDVGTWLLKLNRARAIAADTLPPLTDPGTDTARVSLTFSERAYDLFLTGHRLGDLRRLVRQYRRPQQAVFPTGKYPSGIPVYGSAVNVPIPSSEYVNPLFHGCLNGSA